jgi:hypothetical protein
VDDVAWFLRERPAPRAMQARCDRAGAARVDRPIRIDMGQIPSVGARPGRGALGGTALAAVVRVATRESSLTSSAASTAGGVPPPMPSRRSSAPPVRVEMPVDTARGSSRVPGRRACTRAGAGPEVDPAPGGGRRCCRPADPRPSFSASRKPAPIACMHDEDGLGRSGFLEHGGHAKNAGLGSGGSFVADLAFLPRWWDKLLE